ncbi:MAG: TolC family protein [Gemmatimonadaceae bacterium]|nr:TolC family protein [Gemmatimonadaceae bacterium]
MLLSLALSPVALRAQSGSTAGAPMVLSLNDAIRLATGTSEQVALSRAGEQRAQGQQLQARSALLPQVSSTLNWQKQLQNQFAAISKRASNGTSGGSSESDTSAAGNATSSITRIFASEYNFNLGLTASQPLYTGGRATANIRAARAGRESAEIGITSAQAQAQLDVTQAYYDALLADRLLTISDSTLVQAERTLRQVQLTRSVGSTSEFELIRARVTRDNQRPGWLQARTARDLAYVRLRQLLNLDAERAVALTDSIVEAPLASVVASTAPITTVNVAAADVLAIDPAVQARVARTLATSDTGASGRAPVRQALKGVEVAQQQLRATRAQRLPSLAATTNYQRLAYPTNVLPRSLADFFPNWTVGIGLSYPIFTGGRIRGDILAAEASVIEAQQRLRQAQEGAALDARSSTAKLTEAEASWQASVGTAEQAQRAYEIAEVRFREGISTQLELSETRVQLQQALANRAWAARDLQVARKRLELLRDLPLSSGFTPSTSSNP